MSQFEPDWRPDAAPATLAVGIDLVEVARVAAALARFGDRFLERVFTPAERDLTRRDAVRLAGRFAVKEAGAKALATGIGLVGWRDLECLRDGDGKPIMVLHGPAARLARELGWRALQVSLSTTKHQAVAIVVATA